MKLRIYLFLLIMASCFVANAQGTWNSSSISTWNYNLNAETGSASTFTPDSLALVSVGGNGQLVYRKFANEGESNAVNVIPDFSMCGYKKGGVAIPNITEIKKTLSPLANNADNTAQIQAAIDEVSGYTPDGNGIRGVILLTAGTYNLSDTLKITQSGVILRGEGQGTSGTILMANKASQHAFITIKGTTTSLGPDVSSNRIDIADSYVPTGAKSFRLASVSGLSIGSTIVVVRKPNQAWIDTLQMGQYGWTASGYLMRYERTITNISSDTITIDAPIVDAIQTLYGGGYVYLGDAVGRIENCGVENMRLVSAYDTNNIEDESHGWQAIRILSAQNCWVKQVTAKYFGYSCVSIGAYSRFNTVEECAMLDPISITTGGRKYSFELESGITNFNLFQRCYTRGGRHDFVTGARVPGPNVFLDGYSEETHADIGPHHRWATGLLFDNIKGGEIVVQNRGDMGSGHGWAGAQTLFWKCISEIENIKVESPKGGKNWGIGGSGLRAGAGFWENHGNPVNPRSLYISQLKDRLGSTAVDQVTTVAQRSGSIYELLKTWAGEGALPAQ